LFSTRIDPVITQDSVEFERGATEAFLPEDADLLIENTETGSTIARHNLKIIDTLFESTGRLIGNKNSLSNPAKKARIKSLVDILKVAV